MSPISQPSSISSPACCSSWRCVACRIRRPAAAAISRHGRHGHRHRHDAGAGDAVLRRFRADRARSCHRRRRRRLHRPLDPDDLDAATGRRLPLARRPCRRAGGGLRALYAVVFRHRRDRSIHAQALVEMALGVAIGAITFTGSIIAFLKLDGRMSGKPIMLPFRHVINIALLVLIVFFIVGLAVSESHFDFWAVVALVAGARRAADHADRRRRYAGRRLDAEFLFRLGGCRHRFHARQPRADHHRRAGRLVGRDPVLHHVQGHEPLVHLGHPRRLRRRDGAGASDDNSDRTVKRARPTMPPI